MFKRDSSFFHLIKGIAQDFLAVLCGAFFALFICMLISTVKAHEKIAELNERLTVIEEQSAIVLEEL